MELYKESNEILMRVFNWHRTSTEKIGYRMLPGDIIYLCGGYSATCMEVDDKETIFLFDQVLPKFKAHDECESYFKEVFETTDIFDQIKDIMIPFENGSYLRLPYVEEIFGPYDYYIPSDKTQWPPMKSRKNRIGVDIEDNVCWYWLRNGIKDNPYYFAYVTNDGFADCSYASLTSRLRPAFKIKLK